MARKLHLTRYDIDMPTRGRLLIDKVAGQIGESIQLLPHAQLAFSIFSQAVIDYTSKNCWSCDRMTAIEYLRGPLPHIQLLDIDPDYIKRLYKHYAMTELLDSNVEGIAA